MNENEEVMQAPPRGFNWAHFGLYFAISLGLGIPFAFFFPVASELVVVTRISNGLFFGGLLVCAWGAIGLATNMGAFALIAYSNKKVFQVLFQRNKDLGEKKLGSYFEYLQKKKKRHEIAEMMLGGALPIVFSLVISFIFF